MVFDELSGLLSLLPKQPKLILTSVAPQTPIALSRLCVLSKFFGKKPRVVLISDSRPVALFFLACLVESGASRLLSGSCLSLLAVNSFKFTLSATLLDGASSLTAAFFSLQTGRFPEGYSLVLLLLSGLQL
ncbi:hypothetical protein D2E65_09310 [Mycobacteroides abscessus]|uniref:hypothetical protein n=1 Tax=Mycobacteroides abscessus TaxID=36809 RepID=UPI000C2571CB|nr:hypothetical protein [Mycobacteroides abscessus]RIR81948.1 hypothetical protein D2E65_09310 [Mycobacteroides abscessus]